MSGSSLCLVFGLENVVDFCSSLVVLWRFFAPTLTEADEVRLQSREERASMGISVLLVVLGIFVMTTSLVDASRGPEDVYQYALVATLALLSSLAFGVLTWLKLRFAKRLQCCESLRKDGICSLIGTTLSGVMVFTTVLADMYDNAVWWIDPLMAFLAGMVAIYLGGQALYVAMVVHHKAIYSLAWWWTAQHDGDDGYSADRDANDGISMQEKGTTTTQKKVGDGGGDDDEGLVLEVVDLPNGDDKEIV